MSTPAVDIRAVQVTVPAGTAESSPQVTEVFFPPRILTAVHWRVPPGPSGLMGWRLTMSGGTPVIPSAGGWIVADDESAQWAVQDQPDSGRWEIAGYNTDIYDHTVYVTFLLDVITSPSGVIAVPPPSALSSPPGVAAAGVSAG